MISLYSYLSEPVEGLIFFFLTALSSSWAYFRFKNKLTVSFVPVIILNFILLIIWAVLLGPGYDESAQLHLTWLVSQGMTPYIDFWQHHPPFLWFVLSPYLALLKPSVEIFYLFRLFSGLIFLINILQGWQIAKQTWGKKAKLSVYLLVVSSVSLAAQYLFIRPDIFMIFFLLAGVTLSLKILEKKVFHAFITGIVFALAFSFMIKQYLLFLLPVIAVFLGTKENRLLKLVLYFLGLGAGFLPLLSYLIGHNILRDYIAWVFIFNSKIMVLSVSFPLLITLLSVWGSYILFKHYRQGQETKVLVLLIAFCLSTLSSLTTTTTIQGGYYLAFWFFIVAIMDSGCPLVESLGHIKSLIKRSLVFGLVFSLFVIISVERLLQCYDPLYSADKRVVEKLMKYCANDNCIAFPPSHPIFSRDTTRLNSQWQYNFADLFSSVREDITKEPITAQIISLRPAVIPYRYLKRNFILDLFQKKLISAQDYKGIVKFLQENYTQTKIGEEEYYVRNDKTL